MADGFTEQTLMEHFSEAYVRAIASRAGFSVQRISDDYESVDLLIRSVGYITRGEKRSKRRSPSLAVQIKCTYAHQVNGDCLSYPLRVKNYDDLRGLSNSEPRILIVVCVPEDWDERLMWTPERLVLSRCGFWMSLRGAPETQNHKTVRVHLKERLSPDELERIMYLVAEEKLL